jgi:hypothetical protein
MAVYFAAEEIDKLNDGHEEVHRKFGELRDRYIVRMYKSGRGREYGVHGFGRRLGVLVRAIDQVYAILPPDREDIPERDEVIDATIAIQSFVLNTFGCLDNLAWIWVHEKDIREKDGTELDRKKVGLGSKRLRETYTDDFRAYLDGYHQWFEHLKDLRDSLAHRIPLYVPPFIIRPENVDVYNGLEHQSGEALRRRDFREYDRLQSEQKNLGLFRPWMTHSQLESAPRVVFHPQLLADFNTVDEVGRMMLDQLAR